MIKWIKKLFKSKEKLGEVGQSVHNFLYEKERFGDKYPRCLVLPRIYNKKGDLK